MNEALDWILSTVQSVDPVLRTALAGIAECVAESDDAGGIECRDHGPAATSGDDDGGRCAGGREKGAAQPGNMHGGISGKRSIV